MAPNYKIYSGFTVRDALIAAGAPTYTSQFAAGEPPVTFFSQAPKDSAAVFSTHGQRPFRQVANPTYERVGYFWWAAEIQRVCDELRRNLPEACKKVEAPQSYWDLYKYFDAHDIYYRGAQNLWNVINTFVFENEYAQGLVEKEQRVQVEQYTPLFELLAAELLKKPDVQTKLLSWDKEKQQDVLEVLTTEELQSFEGYEKYPKHFRDAIRIIFSRHCADLQKGLPLANCLACADGGISKVEVPEKLAALCLHLRNTEMEDSFMDKFDIPNKIINGILVVDGTSKTAARRARVKELLTANSHHTQTATRDNGAAHLHTSNVVPLQDVRNSYPETGSANYANDHHPTAKRCSSAPTIGGDPGSILSQPVNHGARVYPGGSHEVDEKLTVYQKPVAQSAMQVTMPALGGSFQHRSITNHPPPPIHYNGGPRRDSEHQFPSVRQQMLSPPSGPVPGPISPNRPSGPQSHRMSQGPFADQISLYTLPQHRMQVPPQTMQQAQQPHLVRLPPNGGGYFANPNPPYSNTGPRQPYNAPPAPSHGPESFGQQRRNSVTRTFSSGQWQRIGSDEIHGPKAVFRKGSDAQVRRISNTSNGSHRRFSNTAHPQQFNNHTGPRQPDKVGAATYSNPRTSANLGYSLSEYGCVNAGKHCTPISKFDPCPCSTCRNRDCTIFVGRLKPAFESKADVLELLKQHFSKYGQVNQVTRLLNNTSAALVIFASPQTSVAAVHAGSNVKIDGLGDRLVHVNFRTGSQFFTPRRPSDSYNNHHFTRNVSQEQGLPMSPPPSNGINNPDAYATPFRHNYHSTKGPVISPELTGPAGRPPNISPNAAISHAINVLDRAAVQSGFRAKEFKESPDFEVTDAVAVPNPWVSMSSNGTNFQGMLDHRPWHGPRLHEAPSHKTSRDLVRDITELTHNVITSSQATCHNTPNHPVHATPPSIYAQGSPVQSAENESSTKPEEGAVLDYSTVRIRRDKAQYEKIPARWRGDTTPHAMPEIPSQPFGPASNSQVIQPMLSPLKDSQQIQTAERRPEDITAQTQQPSNGDKASLEDEAESRIRGASISSKRKAGETDDEGKAPGQPLPKKLAKSSEVSDTVQQRQSSQPAQNQQRDGAGETGQTKAKKKRNYKRKNPAPRLVVVDTSAPAPYEVQTFEPAIAASQLPPYPQQVEGGSVSQLALTPTPLSEPVYVHVPPAHAGPVNPGPSENEPFPVYRDLMSGPQFPLKSHKSHISGLEHNRSFSSDASTIIQDINQRGRVLDPVADSFVPSPRSMSPAPKQGNGNGNGKGKWKPKKVKGMRNDQKSASEGPVNRKPEFEKPNGLKDGDSTKAEVPVNGPKSNSALNNNGTKDVKESHQQNGKDKAEEKLAIKPIEAAPPANGKPKNSKTNSNGAQRAEPAKKETDLNAAEADHSKKASSSSPKSSPAEPKSRKSTPVNAGKKPVDRLPTADDNNNKAAEPKPPALNAVDFPSLPAAPPPKMKPVPALAPIPLRVLGAAPRRAVTSPSPRTTVSGTPPAKGNGNSRSSPKGSAKTPKDVVKAGDGEKGLPDGERKGG
ncbi:hypothetical protein GGR51DRAFT_543321 [Nemania sp. FL0031]|nr:hypothetical protein GGR51DRAFT_543321 [Nemania sp. FL0031]